MPTYLDPITIIGISGDVSEYRQAFPPTNPQNNAIWFQTGGNPNAIWIWNETLKHWLSAAGYTHSESIDLAATSPAFSGRVQLLSVQQSVAGYGLFVESALFTGLVGANNDLTNNWSFQFACGNTALALPLSTVGLNAGSNGVVGRKINSPLLPNNAGKILETNILQTGSPGNLTGIMTLNYRYIYA